MEMNPCGSNDGKLLREKKKKLSVSQGKKSRVNTAPA